MTEPRSGPANQGGQPGGYGPSASGPPAGSGQGNIGSGDMGRGSRGASSVGGSGQETEGSGLPDEGTRQGGLPDEGTRQGAAPSEGAAQGGGVKTRTTPAQATVPQQYGRERGIEGEAGAGTGLGARTAMIASAAGRAWPGVLLCGLGMIALGIMLLVWPAAALTLVAVLIGAAVLVAGLVKLFEGFTASNHSGGMRAGYIVIGLLAVLAGSYLLVHHALSLFLLAFVTGLFFIVHGVADIGAAISGNVPARTLRAVLGVFSCAAGIIMLVWPALTLVLLLTIVAAWLLLYGLMAGGLAYSLRKASKEGSAGAAKGAPSFRRKKLATSTRLAGRLPGQSYIGQHSGGSARNQWSGRSHRFMLIGGTAVSRAGGVTADQVDGPERLPAAGSRHRASGKPSSGAS